MLLLLLLFKALAHLNSRQQFERKKRREEYDSIANGLIAVAGYGAIVHFRRQSDYTLRIP